MIMVPICGITPMMQYLEAKDVERASDLLAELNTIISRLELMKGF